MFSQTYHYNNLGLLEDETLALDGKSFVLDYGFNNRGALSSLAYPDGTPAVQFLPDSFGNPTQAVRTYSDQTTDTFVKGGSLKASWHPNGTVHRFEYGNGVKHLTTQNNRQLPQCIQDYVGATVPTCGVSQNRLNLEYAYDNNLNITSITLDRIQEICLTSTCYLNKKVIPAKFWATTLSTFVTSKRGDYRAT